MVIGEIIAGIFLGPSLLGLLFPDVFNFIFPKETFNNLQYLSQIGLTFFMFSIGMKLDLSKIKKKTYDTVVISFASILIPFFSAIMCREFHSQADYISTKIQKT